MMLLLAQRNARLMALVSASVLFAIASCAQNGAGNWNNFEGRLGNSDMQMSLFFFKNGDLKGNYIIKYVGTKILLSGSRKGSILSLTEQINGQPGRSFKGTITADSIYGSWADIPPRPSLHFSAHLTSSSAGSFEQRYTGLFGTTEDIENFVQNARSAILANNKDWVADHTSFPLRHLSGKGYNGIVNKQQLIQHFSQVFTKAFKDKISSAFTTNLFVKNGAVMLGNGELWISNTHGSTKDLYDYMIIAINP